MSNDYLRIPLNLNVYFVIVIPTTAENTIKKGTPYPTISFLVNCFRFPRPIFCFSPYNKDLTDLTNSRKG